MNILLLTLEYPPFHGGVANYYGNLVKNWPKFDKIIVSNNNDGGLINQRWPFLKWLPAILGLKKIIKNNNIQQIIVGQILPLGPAGLFYRRFYRLKYTVILHGLDFSYATKIWRKRIISRIVLTGAEKIICTNTYTAGLVKSFLKHRADIKIEVVNPGVENFTVSHQLLISQLKQKYNLFDKIILLSVGRLVKRKGFDFVIKAMPEILEKTPNLIYVIVGNGQEIENWKFEIGNLKLENKVLIINQATDAERNHWYSLCDIFIMPSRNINGDFEGFGIVYLEANLAGKPVIAGKSGGVSDAVADGLNGLLVDGESVNEISQAIIKLAFDPELRHRLGKQGKERAINDFNWGRQVKKIYKIVH